MHRGRRGKRIGVALVCAMAAVSVAVAQAAPASADVATVSAQVGATPTGPVMPSGFVGVSFEYRAMHVYTGRDPNAINPVLIALLKALAPGQRPVIRIGGDSTDATWWPIRGMIPPGGINYALTKGWLRTTLSVVRALGGHVIMGINLASGRPAIAVAEAQAIMEGIGARYIQALEIGNEADLYGTFPWYRDRRGHVVLARPHAYGPTDFINDFSRWRSLLPAVPLAGPAFAGLGWMSSFDSFLAAEPSVRVATFHRYPLRACVNDPTDPFFASITNLLADSSSAGLAQQVAPFATDAHSHSDRFRLDELNSAACSGRRGVSNTFASALWALDTLFNLAAVGVDGVNIHTLPGSAYEPFTFTQTGRRWSAFVHPMYYGLLMFAQAFPPGATLLPVSAPAGAVKVWATQASDGTTRVVVINKSTDTPVHVELQLPGAQTPAAAESLLAPSVGATSGVTLGRQTFGPQTTTGVLPAPEPTAITPAADGTYAVDLPPASAVMLTR